MRLAVGFFDGVHLGHRAILRESEVALTFSTHPLALLDPARAPTLLMSLDERLAAIRACGVRDVRVLDFTRELAGTEPEDFLAHLPGVSDGVLPIVRCGADWRFGRGGRGDSDFLRARGFTVETVSDAVCAGERVSSSRIRGCLAAGELGPATRMLGRPYAVTGRVVPGKGLGHAIGYPTLNVDPGRRLGLRTGAYAVRVDGRVGVANFGLAPTAGERAWREPTLEVHLLEGDGGGGFDRVSVEFVAFLRDERRFASLGELTRQIAADCDFARALGARKERTDA